MRFELPPGLKPVHEMLVPMRWGDMDAMGHVNNTLYFRFMEVVRLDWLFKLGCSVNGAGQGPIIVNAFCNFLRQLEFPGDVRVTMLLGAAGRSSVDSYHRLERSDTPGVVYAEGGATMVWTDHAAKKSAPMPDWFRQRLG